MVEHTQMAVMMRRSRALLMGRLRALQLRFDALRSSNELTSGYFKPLTKSK